MQADTSVCVSAVGERIQFQLDTSRGGPILLLTPRSGAAAVAQLPGTLAKGWGTLQIWR